MVYVSEGDFVYGTCPLTNRVIQFTLVVNPIDESPSGFGSSYLTFHAVEHEGLSR